jgi:IS30 family transposase
MQEGPFSPDDKGRRRKPGGPRKLSQSQAEEARKLIESGKTRQEIADLLGVHKMTLYRELSGNRWQGKAISVEVNGAVFEGCYRVVKGLVVVSISDRYKSRQSGDTRPEVMAKALLTELAIGAAHRPESRGNSQLWLV